MRVLVLGGSRFLGRNLVRALINKGHDITIFNRGNYPDSRIPKGVKIVHGDRSNKLHLERLGRSRFDTIFDTSGYFPEQISLAVDRFQGNCDHYVYCSSAVVYAEPVTFPLREENLLGSWPVWGEYGENKRACEEVIWNARKKTGFPVSTIRPVYILGPDNYLNRESFILERLLSNSRIIIPGSGTALIQFIFVDEVAHILMTMMENVDRTIGKSFNCCGDEFVTLNGFVSLFAKVSDSVPLLVHTELDQFGIPSVPYEAEDVFPFSNTSIVCSNERLKQGLGYNHFLSLEEGLRNLYAWYRDRCKGAHSISQREAMILSKLDSNQSI